MASLPVHIYAHVGHALLADDLVVEGVLHGPEAGDVLNLHPLPALQADVGVDPDGALPPRVVGPQVLQDEAQLVQEEPGLLRAGDVRLRHDLHQGHPRPVVVDEGVQSVGDVPADVHQLRRVLLQVDPGYPDGPAVQEQVASLSQGDVVLGYLEVLGHIRVEVVLPGDPDLGEHPAVEGLCDLDAVLHRPPVHLGLGAGEAEADGARVLVGLPAVEVGAASAEELALRPELDVDLEAHYRLHRLTSYACAAWMSVPSWRWSAMRCSPTGRPPTSPQGTEIMGIPARFGATVRTSIM